MKNILKPGCGHRMAKAPP